MFCPQFYLRAEQVLLIYNAQIYWRNETRCVTKRCGPNQRLYNMNGSFKWLDFAERCQCKPVLLSHWLEPGQTTYIPLWDRMEGERLWTQGKIIFLKFFYQNKEENRTILFASPNCKVIAYSFCYYKRKRK
jgi:hypothetical protein